VMPGGSHGGFQVGGFISAHVRETNRVLEKIRKGYTFVILQHARGPSALTRGQCAAPCWGGADKVS
jgi:hypothetical protein